MGVGISIGVAIGVALGPLFENIGIGIAISIAARRITDGQTVTVDGSAGTVSLS